MACGGSHAFAYRKKQWAFLLALKPEMFFTGLILPPTQSAPKRGIFLWGSTFSVTSFLAQVTYRRKGLSHSCEVQSVMVVRTEAAGHIGSMGRKKTE